MRLRLATGLPLHRGPDSYWGDLSTPPHRDLSGSFVQTAAHARIPSGDVHLRRAILLFALVLGLTALAAAVSPTPQDTEPPEAPTPAAPATPVATRVVDFDVSESDEEPQVRRARAGGHLVLTVTSIRGGLVTIPRLGRTASVSAAAPARFDVLAPDAGRYDVLLQESGGADEPRRIGTLVTHP